MHLRPSSRPLVSDSQGLRQSCVDALLCRSQISLTRLRCSASDRCHMVKRALVRRMAMAFGSLAMVVSLGCSGEILDRVPVVPVTGEVKQGSDPVANALVVLHPDGSNPKVLAARGQTDEQGRFSLTTYEASDGAAVGSYRVTVVAYETINDGGSIVPGPNILPTQYSTPESSGLKVTVPDGGGSVGTISLED